MTVVSLGHAFHFEYSVCEILHKEFEYFCLLCVCVQTFTLITEPSGAPKRLRVTETKGNESTFSWEEVEYSQRNGLIRSYEYKIYYNKGLIKKGCTTTAEVTMKWINNCHHLCSITVAAVNLAGVGPHSRSVRFEEPT